MFAPKSKLFTVVVLASAAVATGAAADGSSYRQKAIDNERGREGAAIEQGRYTGELTRREYRQLKAEQAHIADMEKKALSDGYISKREFREIRQAQADASRHIEDETHDRQKSFWRRWLYLNR